MVVISRYAGNSGRGGRGHLNTPYFKKRNYIPQKTRMIAAMRSGSTEIKTVDIVNTGTSTNQNFNVFGLTAGLVQLNDIALGTDVYNRIGRKIHMKSIHIRAAILPTGNATGNELLRMSLVYDRQSGTAGAAAVYAEIFSSQDFNGNVTSNIWDYTSTTNFDRFVVLRDWKFSCPNGVATVLSGNNSNAITDYQGKYKIDEYVKLKDMVAHYGQAAVSGAVPVTGQLLLVFHGSVANANAGYQAAWNARIRFADTQ